VNVRTAKRFLTAVDAPAAWGALGALGALAVAARPTAARHLAVGHAWERARVPERALVQFDAAAVRARESERASELRWLHPSQFAAERLRARLGQARVEDPLITCRVASLPSDRRSARAADAGRFAVEITDNGLRVFGSAASGVARVRIEVDGLVVRHQTTGGSKRRPEFTFAIQRSALAAFGTRTTLRVRDDHGTPLRTPAGSEGFVLEVPHGDGSLRRRLAGDVTLDKKGGLPLDAGALAGRRVAYLDLYARALAAFGDVLDRPLFLMYGTLLGCWRDGDLIPGDDDFDVGYLAEGADPERVKAETLTVIEQLVASGFVVSFNRRGRLFRLSDPAADAIAPELRVHLDVRPVWFDAGSAWAHNHFTMPSEPSDWAPFAEARLGGVRVLVPRATERFLAHQYGPGWRSPDPGFTYHRDAIPEAVWAYLARALVTPTEYRRLRSALEARPTVAAAGGRFVADAWDDLYPLARDRVATP